MQTVAVIGGGITGQVAARRLDASGCDVSLFEASGRLGGQIKTADIDGLRIEVGAEALHLTNGDVSELVSELKLDDDIVPANSSFVWVWDGKRRRKLPAGIGPNGPTRLLPVARSGMLSPRGIIRAGLEPFVPADTTWSKDGEDIGVGPFIAQRFGKAVSKSLVDPVLGSIHCADINRLSLRAATPAVARTALEHRSLLLASRGAKSAAPLFVNFGDGLSALGERIVAETGVNVSLNTPVKDIAVDPTSEVPKYILNGDAGELGKFDAVIVALPAAAAPRVLTNLVPQAAEEVANLRAASVATAVFGYPANIIEANPVLQATGMLSASTSPLLLKAATFLSTKWPHLQGSRRYYLRLTAGRIGDDRLGQLDDEQLVAQLLREFAATLGVTAEPEFVHVERWPNALPQLEVGHLNRIQKLNAQLATYPGLLVAGAAYDGLGISACITAGNKAAQRLGEL